VFRCGLEDCINIDLTVEGVCVDWFHVGQDGRLL